MSLDPKTPAANTSDLQTIAARLDALDAALSTTLRESRRRKRLSLLVAIVGILLVGYWLSYAHKRFTNELNPTLVADLGQSYLDEYLPNASAQLETSLKDNAPSVIDQGESRLRALPASLDEQFKNNTRQELDARMPEVQDRLYQSLKAGLADAQAQIQKTPGQNDSDRFRAVADALGAVYRTDVVTFTDDTYSQYSHGANDIVNGLNMLAEDKKLTPEQKTQRNLVRDFLILAHDAVPAEPKILPDAK